MSQDNYDDEHRFQQLIEYLNKVAVQGYNEQREVIYWNDASTSLYGYSKKEALGEKLEDLIIPDDMRHEVIEAHQNWIENGVAIPASELKLQNKNGALVPVFSSHVMLKQNTDKPEMFCVDVDLSEQYKSAEKLKKLANQDSLTKLPNRRYLEGALERRINEANRFNQRLGVLFIDLDHFKDINDTMGHHVGDILLKIVSHRLQSHSRKYDLITRFGGDVFVVLLPQIQKVEHIEAVAQKFISDFENTYPLDGQEVYVTASIGVSVFPENGETVSKLLQNADTAMYHAKSAGRNRYQFFTASMNEELKRHRQIVTSLHQALQQDEFSLVYQPQINMATNEIESCEALLRFTPSDSDTLMSPAEFIPIAEQSDLIVRIGYWVLDQACRQLSEWRQNGLSALRIDINVSGKQLLQCDFINFFKRTIDKYGLTPSDIGIELTEHALISINDDTLNQLRELKASGVNISLDDFGTGYSSLSYLKTFPVDYLKIDRSFIKDIEVDAHDKAIMQAIVEVGHKMDMKIVAEGIETLAQKKVCQTLSCDLAQGYHFYNPMPANELLNLIKE